MSTDLLIFS